MYTFNENKCAAKLEFNVGHYYLKLKYLAKSTNDLANYFILFNQEYYLQEL